MTRSALALLLSIIVAACTSAPTPSPSTQPPRVACDQAPATTEPHLECAEAVAAAVRAVPANQGPTSVVTFHYGCSEFGSGPRDCNSPRIGWVEIDLAGGPPWTSITFEISKGLDGIVTATLVGAREALP